jgi:hypothetical protein
VFKIIRKKDAHLAGCRSSIAVTSDVTSDGTVSGNSGRSARLRRKKQE